MLQKIMTFLNHERYQVVCLVICLAIVVTGVCCESQTTSIMEPGRKVTRSELKAELDKLIIDVDLRYADLNRQDELKALIYDHVMLWSTTGAFNPSALVPLLASVLGVGAVVDNVRKRKDLKALSDAGTVKPTTT